MATMAAQHVWRHLCAECTPWSHSSRWKKTSWSWSWSSSIVSSDCPCLGLRWSVPEEILFRKQQARALRSSRLLVRSVTAYQEQTEVTSLQSKDGKSRTKQALPVEVLEVEKGKYSYDVENSINQLSALAPRGSIARCMESFRNRLSMQDFSLIFREFAQRGDWHRALRLFKYMQRQQWCKPNEHIYTIMIGIMGREGLLEKCSELFEEMPANAVEWNVYSFTALINAYGRNGQHDSSLALLARMKRERVTPNLITYNTVINACAKGELDWEGLLGLFAQMRHEGIQPDIITYNTLLSACSSRGLVEEAGMVFRTMNEAGVVPDLITYTSLVDTYGRGGRYEGAAELLREMERAGNVPDVLAYNVLIEAYSKVGEIGAAAAVFRQMQQAGCPPNVSTYSTLLEAYGKHGFFHEVRNLFVDMKARGTEPNVVTYNTLIGVFGQGGYFRESISLFHDMLDAGVEPDMQTYTGLVYSCGKGGLHKEATEIYRHMLRRGIDPTVEVYNGLINAYGKAAMYQEAEIAFSSMLEADCKPDQAVYDALIESYARGGLYQEAGATFMRMHEAGMAASVRTFNSLIQAYGRVGLHKDAITIFQDMLEARQRPDQQTYEALLSVYCYAGLFDEAKAQFLEMKEGGVAPQATSYCLMLAVCARRSRWSDAHKLLDEMQRRTMQELHVTVSGLIRGEYDEGTKWQMVEHVFDNLKVDGVGSNMIFFSALLEVLWGFNQRRRGVRVLEEARRRGVFAEAYHKGRIMWSIDIHRMGTGAALIALAVWLDSLRVAAVVGDDFPQALSVVTKGGATDSEVSTKELPVANAIYSSLTTLGAPFKFAPWNEGRIVSHGGVLKSWLLKSTTEDTFALTNQPLPEVKAPEKKLSTGRRKKDLTNAPK